ncbi:hypothetical protein J2X01_000296 [Arthrobacter ginsengisoli]|uniref:Uncharacterized protein n=1 Tax=Arthrobacter ginsengisoli TaxID=1356565 RepID=A0ABU1U769_9MICC|nr:hypothetical protein [Arthrobacter ginsengisoli]MDR7081027.1 hypothetical protein [Arthrobacter ginsengisoli]
MSDPAAFQPSLQMYSDPDFVEDLLIDPGVSLKFGQKDVWSYPVPAKPGDSAQGRNRLATSRLVRTKLRKLYQPAHNRFYLVVVEVFCDRPGLPRAGGHDDLEVSFVLRRRSVSVAGRRPLLRTLARNLIIEKAEAEGLKPEALVGDCDVADFLWADDSARNDFIARNTHLFGAIDFKIQVEKWLQSKAGTRWADDEDAARDPRPDETEQEFPMWRIPPREGDCAAVASRSLWFGVVPTFSSDHWTRTIPSGSRKEATVTEPKLDDHGLYQLACCVRQKPVGGREHCPRPEFWSAPSETFRLASMMDPEGTENRTTTVVLPDFRRLAASLGGPARPGGLRVVTPPRSQLVFSPFDGPPKPGKGSIGAGGGVCTFAIELLFIVAFFLFSLFLPIVVLAFQLWWMLALRFCFPPAIAFDALKTFLETKPITHADFTPALAATLNASLGTDLSGLDKAEASEGWNKKLPPDVAKDRAFTEALVDAARPAAEPAPDKPVYESSPPDPLCEIDAADLRLLNRGQNVPAPGLPVRLR